MFCLITPVVAANGPQILGSLAFVLLVAYIGYILHASLVYSLTVKSLAGIGPLKFFKGMAPAMIMAFSSASSVGALPLNLECAEKLGARKEVALPSIWMEPPFTRAYALCLSLPVMEST